MANLAIGKISNVESGISWNDSTKTLSIGATPAVNVASSEVQSSSSLSIKGGEGALIYSGTGSIGLYTGASPTLKWSVAADGVLTGAASQHIACSNLTVRGSTADGTDNASLFLTGGGGVGGTRGGWIEIHGDEYATDPGAIIATAGNVVGAKAKIVTVNNNAIELISTSKTWSLGSDGILACPGDISVPASGVVKSVSGAATVLATSGTLGLQAGGDNSIIFTANSTAWWGINGVGTLYSNGSQLIRSYTPTNSVAAELTLDSYSGASTKGSRAINLAIDGATKWSVLSDGVLQSSGSQTVKTSSGDMYLQAAQTAYIQTLGTTYYWAFQNDGYLSIPANKGIYSGGDITMHSVGASHTIFYTNSTLRFRVSSDGTKVFYNGAIYIASSAISSGAGNSTLKYDTGTGLMSWDSSSRLVKDNIVDSPYGLAEVLEMQPRKYLRTDDQRDEIGFIADELIEIAPEFVGMGPLSNITHNDEDTEIVPTSVSYDKLTAVLCKAIQELADEVSSLKTQLQTHLG